MRLKGSCHCQAVKFSLKSKNVYPYQLCYCSICRKTQGGGGFSINISGEASTLVVSGKKILKSIKQKLKILKTRENGKVLLKEIFVVYAARPCGCFPLSGPNSFIHLLQQSTLLYRSHPKKLIAW